MKKWSPVVFCALLLTLLLTACGTGSGSTTTSVPTPKPPTPTPTPTATLTTYNGDGYSIGYPQGWTTQKSSNGLNLVGFTNDQLGTLFVQIVPNPTAAPLSSIVNGALGGFKGVAKNYQDVNIASPTTINGTVWTQAAATADLSASGQTKNAKIIVLATNHPDQSGATRTFVIFYSGDTQNFAQTEKNFFLPMVQSFKFM